ncbi:rhombosortase [Shewanella yunxiaonensis]|uniref:Rhombosortase n=1 Tax=Shewanella yunxiaonensis TaxID=2829809 RepID=A0ABX7YP36_9GAMM|nr:MULTISPECIES: rhombosortase [Shewanella]MDF0536005.1 rhombosortase [Shewanella sp. A32]QUN04503.1 rhombosortase [Shewanella yunxiaonensis]
MSWRDSPWLTVLAVSLLCVTLQWSGATEALEYQRQFIADGQWWRLLTGNLLHTNNWHLLMNLAGFWVVVFIHRTHYHNFQLACLLAILLLSEGLGLWLAFPALTAYVGLSGILHGLFTYGALNDIRIGWRSGYLLLAGVIAKVIWEQFMGGNSEVTQLIGARVATEAHLVGLVDGILAFMLFRFMFTLFPFQSKNKR